MRTISFNIKEKNYNELKETAVNHNTTITHLILRSLFFGLKQAISEHLEAEKQLNQIALDIKKIISE